MQRTQGAQPPATSRRFERLTVPPELDGHDGLFTSAEPNTLGVSTDLQAIDCWLFRYVDTPATHATYTRAIERFYLWCLLVKRKPMSSLVEEDFADYKRFLLAPPDDWIRARHVGRDSSNWRPFRGPLSEVTAQREFSAISGYVNALIVAGYLRVNAAVGHRPGQRLPFMRIRMSRQL